MSTSLLILLALATTFGFLNGFNDSSSMVATVITSGALPPRLALTIAAVCNFIAPLILPLAVATTLGEGMLVDTALRTDVVIAGLSAAVIWNLITYFLGLPSSSSHALVGGLLGAAIVSQGLAVVRWAGLAKILIALFISPPLGLLVGFVVMRVTLRLADSSTPQVNRVFNLLQVPTLIGLSLGHGSNDGEKTIGVIAMALVTSGYQGTFHVPLWAILLSGASIGLGTSLGAWRLIRTLGARIFRIRPIHGFTSQLAGASVILCASFLGGPVSTTQVLSSAIMGVGAAERLGKVHWNVLRDLLTAWVLTIPACAAISLLLYLVIFH
ncbi:MAG: inorganic phosphate transporter [Anaerolineales bacterium]|jgi:PiT family inorganic phosphate transporter